MESCKSRICLTCDGWTTCTSHCYYALTSHFTDDDWKLHSLLLNFRRFPPPHDGESEKVFSITLDNASSNVRMVEKLKRDLHSSSPLPLDGNSVTKLRKIVKYVDSSDFRLINFEKAKNDRGLESKEWDTIQNICDFLEPFYHIFKLFSCSKYPTSNLYLYCIVCLEKVLTESHTDPSDAVRMMATPMWKNFDKYWSDHSMVLSFALTLDPRFKITYLTNLYFMLYVPTAV
ncbi:Zinc finger BED domain-containing protein RICESLEEPER 2 [Bienertia sinuspersici]